MPISYFNEDCMDGCHGIPLSIFVLKFINVTLIWIISYVNTDCICCRCSRSSWSEQHVCRLQCSANMIAWMRFDRSEMIPIDNGCDMSSHIQTITEIFLLHILRFERIDHLRCPFLTSESYHDCRIRFQMRFSICMKNEEMMRKSSAQSWLTDFQSSERLSFKWSTILSAQLGAHPRRIGSRSFPGSYWASQTSRLSNKCLRSHQTTVSQHHRMTRQISTHNNIPVLVHMYKYSIISALFAFSLCEQVYNIIPGSLIAAWCTFSDTRFVFAWATTIAYSETNKLECM